MKQIFSRYLIDETGASAVMVAIVLAMLLAVTALAVDIGYMYATRNELQNVADAAALAGANELGRIYLSMSDADQSTYNAQTVDGDGNGINDITQIKAAAQNVSVLNKAAKKKIVISSTEIIIGKWDWNNPPPPIQKLSPNYSQPDAVEVTAHRDSKLNNAVTTFFGFIFSFFGGAQDTFEVSTIATAALSGPDTVEEGVLKAPFAISEQVLDSCPNVIRFSPTTESCAAWHNFFDPMNANTAAAKAIDMIEGFKGTSGTEGHDWLLTHYDILPSQSPTAEVTDESSVGDIFDFQGGVIAKLFTSGGYYTDWDNNTGIATNPITGVVDNVKSPAPFINLFDFYRFRDGDGGVGDTVDACLYGTLPANDVWSTTVPVYEDPGSTCANVSGPIKIVGFANIVIVMPNPPPDNTVDVCLSCSDVVEPGRGGGGNIGNVLGSLPNLVQ